MEGETGLVSRNLVPCSGHGFCCVVLGQQEVVDDRSGDTVRHAHGGTMARRAVPAGRADKPGRSSQRIVRLLVGGARPFFVEGHRPAAQPSRHDLPAAQRARPACRDRRRAGRRQGIRPAAGHHLRHRFRPAVPVRRDRMDAWHAPGGPGAVRAAVAGPGRGDDRGRGRRDRGRAPGRPTAPAADPAVAALASGLRPQDHRPRPGRRPMRHWCGEPGGGRRHGAGPDAVRAAHRVLAR